MPAIYVHTIYKQEGKAKHTYTFSHPHMHAHNLSLSFSLSLPQHSMHKKKDHKLQVQFFDQHFPDDINSAELPPFFRVDWSAKFC